jgi:uncharacterized protein YbaP (TraB family)
LTAAIATGKTEGEFATLKKSKRQTMRILILLCLIIPVQAISATSLWRVSKGDSELFIGGTVHVLGKGDYPLPKEFSQAYKKSQKLVLETDLNSMNKPEMQSQLLHGLMYSKGQSLKNNLKPATYNALQRYLNASNIPVNSVQQFKPALVMLTLVMTELQRLDLADAGVDAFFNQQALADGKPLGQLESMEKQLEMLENIGKGHEDELILSTLDDLKKLPREMNDLKAAWRSGDLAQLEALGITPLRKDYPALYQSVLVKRNASWLPQIEAFLQTPETELILIGALHLAGTEGVLAQLRQRGYKVTAF